MKRRRWPLTVISLLLYAFLYAPIAVVVVYSFNASRYGGPWRGSAGSTSNFTEVCSWVPRGRSTGASSQ